MRKKLIVDEFYGGMSSDPNVGGVGSFYEGRGVETRKNSKFVKLSNNYGGNTTVINSRANGFIVGAVIYQSTDSVLASRDGRLSNFLTNDVYYIDSTYTTFYNCFEYGTYGVIIASNGILRWAINTSRADLGTLENSVVTSGTFSSATGWTVGTNWAISGGVATHTPGSTDTLTQTLTVTNTTKYIVNVKSTCTAGSVVVSMGGANLGTITTAEHNIAQTYSRTTASTSEALTFTPSNDFAGAVDYIYVQKSNVALAVSGTFTSDAVYTTLPYNIYIGNTATVTSIDTTTSSWTSTAPCTIDANETIKGITKVGDQIFIYSSDGSNGRQYLWDGIETTPSRQITWYDKPITRVLNLNNIDYLVVKTDLKSAFYVVNGYQPELIIKSDNIITSAKDRFNFTGTYINSIETIGNMLLIPTEGGLYTYGNFHSGYPRAMVREFTWNGGEPTTTFNKETLFNLYAFYQKTISGTTYTYGVPFYQKDGTSGTSTYSRSDPGFIRLHPFFGTGYAQKKASVMYKIGAKIPTNTSINIYSRADDQTGYANFYTDEYLNPITTLPTVGATYTNNSNTYTVTSVTQTTSTSCIIHTTYTLTNTVNYSGTLTKSTGTGDSSIVFYRSNEFKLIKTLSNSTRLGQTFIYPENYNKIEWIIELVTTSATTTPELYEFIYTFDELENDI